ncbi:MAG: low molecular weight protein-tyrosine-phosphatase [Flavobacteriaceae bacterium]
MKPGHVLMVCLGNICRSPLAHGIFDHLLNNPRFTVDSAGTANYHVGAAPDKRSIATAKRHRIDISQQQARQFRQQDFDYFDYIYVMDKQNLKHVLALAQNDLDRSKVRLLLGKEEVEDPYYGGPEGFEVVYKKIYNACKSILAEWKI